MFSNWTSRFRGGAANALTPALDSPFEDKWSRFAELLPTLGLLHPNVLLVGPAAQADRMLERLRPYLRAPMMSWAPRARSESASSPGTIVIRGVEGLSAVLQQRVLALSDRTSRDLQIVSIASAPVFPSVQRGAFLDRLYYRLNPVYVDLTPPTVRRRGSPESVRRSVP
jgi:hypothetical protein